MHSCPECGQACGCGGDVEDILWDDESEEAVACEHDCDPEDELDDFDLPGDDKRHRGGYAAEEQE